LSSEHSKVAPGFDAEKLKCVEVAFVGFAGEIVIAVSGGVRSTAQT
jgi:hypothetical protein